MKYYAQLKEGNKTLRKIIADSDEEALQKAVELFGTDNVIVGKNLQKALTKEEKKELRYYQNQIVKVFES